MNDNYRIRILDEFASLVEKRTLLQKYVKDTYDSELIKDESAIRSENLLRAQLKAMMEYETILFERLLNELS